MKQASDKSYAIAVCICMIFGVIGVHHFYLGRWLEGIIDLGLLIGAIVLFSMGYPGWALILFLIDVAHTFIVTIMLLVGAVKDGSGKVVCYPGQKLNPIPDTFS